MTTVDAILERWPLQAMLGRLQITVPTRGKFRSPFRPDNNPSCEIYRDTIKDRSSGETYDAIQCFAEAKGLSNSDAIKTLAAELPGRGPKVLPIGNKPTLTLPQLHYTQAEARALATLRGLGVEGPEMAGAIYGTLGFGTVAGFDCWILSDKSRKLAEARRLDGKMFPAIGNLGERKSHTLKGSCKSWPLGMSIKVSVPAGFPVVIVEGSPDYLAACEIAFHAKREFLPVAMLGASQAIHPDALEWFKGRDVLILAHPDAAGLASAKKWAGQLKQAGANPIGRQLEGGDLCDLVKLHGGKAVAALLNL